MGTMRRVGQHHQVGRRFEHKDLELAAYAEPRYVLVRAAGQCTGKGSHCTAYLSRWNCWGLSKVGSLQTQR